MVHLTLHATAFPALRPYPWLNRAGRVYKAAWQPGDGEVLACATDVGGIMWDMERKGTGLKPFGTNMKMRDMAWSRDGLLLATVGEETVVWKSDGTRLTTLQFDPQVKTWSIRCPKFNNSGQLLAVQEYKLPDKFFVFDVVTGACLKTVTSADTVFKGVSFTWKNELELYCVELRTITLHKVGQDGPVEVLTSRFSLRHLLFNEKSGVLASSSGCFGVQLWNPSQQTPASILYFGSTVVSMVWHPQKSTVLAGCLNNGQVQIWDTLTRTRLKILKVKHEILLNPSWYNRDISFSPDGRFLAVIGENVSLCNVSTGDLVAVCKTEVDNPIQVGWSPSGEKLAVNVENSVSVFNLENIVRMTLRTLSLIKVAECLEMNIENGRDDVEKLFREKGVPLKFVEEVNSYLE